MMARSIRQALLQLPRARFQTSLLTIPAPWQAGSPRYRYASGLPRLRSEPSGELAHLAARSPSNFFDDGPIHPTSCAPVGPRPPLDFPDDDPGPLASCLTSAPTCFRA